MAQEVFVTLKQKSKFLFVIIWFVKGLTFKLENEIINSFVWEAWVIDENQSNVFFNVYIDFIDLLCIIMIGKVVIYLLLWEDILKPGVL